MRKAMKYIVPIDRASIRPNPTAGRTEANIPVLDEVTASQQWDGGEAKFQAVGKVQRDVIGNFNGRFVCIKIEQNLTRNTKPPYQIGGEYDLKLAPRHVSQHRQYENVKWAQPEPDWLYNHADIVVTCEHCGASYPDTELEWDDDDESGATWSICPKCHAADPCELVYEKISDVMRD
jgi:hypothetical protein